MDEIQRVYNQALTTGYTKRLQEPHDYAKNSLDRQNQD